MRDRFRARSEDLQPLRVGPTLRLHLENCLKLRRRLGYKLVVAGILLRNFVRFAEQEGARRINTKLAVRWATLPSETNEGPICLLRAAPGLLY